MIKVGKYNLLKVVRERDFGFFLSDGKEDVLLPKRNLKKDIKVDETIEAFIYRDSEDRLVATLNTPLVTVDEIAYLEVKSVTNIGAFVDIGLERDVLVPLKEQKYDIKAGKSYLFRLYVDKTNRLAATLNIENDLSSESPYNIGDEVSAVVYGFSSVGSALVAVDNKFKGIILKNEFFKFLTQGEQLAGKVRRIYEDGTLGLSLRLHTIKEEKESLETTIINYLKANNNSMPYNDNSSPEDIRRAFHTSKNYFKKALGGLMKKRLIVQSQSGTQLIKEEKEDK
ncbi:MAG: S1 RNA-binding domain-containing protein [Clostridiaceae bacterium]